MSLAVRLAAEAAIELDEAAGWYESQRVELGETFVGAVEAAIGLVTDDEARVLAVAHDRRKPGYSASRT